MAVLFRRVEWPTFYVSMFSKLVTWQIWNRERMDGHLEGQSVQAGREESLLSFPFQTGIRCWILLAAQGIVVKQPRYSEDGGRTARDHQHMLTPIHIEEG